MSKTYLISEEMLQRTLNALIDFNEQSKHGTALPAEIDDCMELLREILASPPEEPVAWIDGGDLRGVGNGNSVWVHPDDQGRMIPLYRKNAP